MATAVWLPLTLFTILTLAIGIFPASGDGKDPYLDLTCVASQALVPTAADSSLVTIAAFTPLASPTYLLDGTEARSFNPGRVGDFRCSVETNNHSAETTVIVSTADANLYPPRLTYPVGRNEDIVLKMIKRTDCQGSRNYRWWVDEEKRSYSNATSLDLSGIDTRKSSIVFRAFLDGCRNMSAFVQVLVRECPSGPWDPVDVCQQNCSICLNGGMCHPGTGQCICPPGFSGPECRTIHGGNVFGQSGQYNCSQIPGPYNDTCRGKLFCLPEPFGCTCGAGYHGIDCTEECVAGRFGANCEQFCHCQDNSSCHADTGECNNNSPCLKGWVGYNCQEFELQVNLAFEKVNLNQWTNITCTVRYQRPLNESEFVLVLPDGDIVGPNYFVEYRDPVEMEYVFNVVPNVAMAMYTCTDVAMTTNATITVTAYEPPQLLRRPTVLTSSDSSVTLNWEEWDLHEGDRGEGPLVKYIITYRLLSPDNATMTPTITAGETLANTTVFEVLGLAEWTRYEFRVLAARPGIGGLGDPSPPAFVNTTCAVPVKPTRPKIRVLNATALYASWSSPPDAACPEITYHLKCSVKLPDQTCEERNYSQIFETTREHSVVFGQLYPCTRYKIMVYAMTNGGDSARVSRTKETAPGSPMLLLNGTTSSSLKFFVRAPDCSYQHCSPLGYYYQLFFKARLINEGTTPPSDEAVEIRDLLPCNEYDLQVRAWTSAGNGTFTDLQSAATKHAVPDEITHLQISNITSDKVRASWSPPVSAPCPITNYTVSHHLVQWGQCAGSLQVAADTHTLTTSEMEVDLTVLLPSSEYKVVVVAWTTAGEGLATTKSFRTTEGVPGPPVLLSNATTNTTAEFTWLAPDCRHQNGLLLGYHFQLVDADGDILEEGTRVPSILEIEFEGLLPCTVYGFHVRAWTSAGNGPFSDIQRVTTELGVPGPIRSLEITQKKSRSLEVRWQPPLDINCPIAAYSLTYSQTKRLACQEERMYTAQELMTVMTNLSHTISNLSPYSEYLLSVRALTSATLAGEASSASAETLEDKPSSPPVAISNTSATPTSLGFTWQAPPCAARNGIVLRFQCELTNGLSTERMSNGTVTTAVFVGLRPCTEYAFTVRAATSMGNSAWSAPLKTSTLPQAPNAVKQISAVPDAEDALVIWQPADNNSCPITGYLISHRFIRHLQCPEEATDTEARKETAVVLPSVTQHDITGLRPAAEYIIDVQALSDGGFGKARNITIETLGSTPGSPLNVSLLQVTSRSLAFAWDPPICSQKRGTILAYIYRLIDSSNEEVVVREEVPANVTTAEVDELVPCSRYQLKVRAKTLEGSGNSGMSDIAVTDMEVPEMVTLRELSAQKDSILVKWIRPSHTPCPINNYLISHQLVRQLQCPDMVSHQVAVQNATLDSSSLEYRIEGLLPASLYTVIVRAKNSQGSGEPVADTVSTQESVPGAVTNVTVAGIGRYSANFTWSPPGCEDSNGDITGYRWQSSPSGSNEVQEGFTTNTSLVITSYKPCSNYTFQVSAATIAGHGQDSPVVSISTRVEVPGKVDDRTIGSVTNATFAIVQWQSPVSADNPCPIQYYTVRYYIKRILACLLTPNETFTQTTSDLGLGLADLRPYTRYKVQVRATTARGHGMWSKEVKLETEVDVPGQIRGVRVTNATTGSLRIEWDQLECEVQHDTIKSYQYLVEGGTTDDDREEVDTDELFANLEDLESCTKYTFQVRAVGQKLPGQWSDPITTVTTTALPEKVLNLTVQRGTPPSSQLLVSWQPQLVGNCSISTFRVGYQGQSIACSNGSTSSSAGTSNWTYLSMDSQSTILDNLRPFWLYTVVVQGETGAGLGEEAQASLETAEDVPSRPPQNISADEINATSVHFSWQPPACAAQNGLIVGYNYSMLHAALNKVVAGGTVVMATEIHIDGLAPFVQYVFSVMAGTAAGLGPADNLLVETAEGRPFPPRNARVVKGDSRTLDLEWQLPSPPTGIVSAYQIKLWPNQSDESTATVVVHHVTETTNDLHHYTIQGLKPYTLYHIQIQGMTSAGYGRWTNTLRHQTAQAAPEEPANASVLERTASTITIQWENPLVTNGVVTGYQIEYEVVDRPFQTEEDSGLAASSAKVVRFGPQSRQAELVKLETAAGYEVRIAAVTVEPGGFVILQPVYTKIPDINPPKMPDKPELIDDNTVILKLQPSASPYISVYQVTVAVSNTGNKRRDTATVAGVSKMYKQSPSNYIAAEFERDALPDTFRVGDNQTYGRYHNAPLQPGTTYAIQVCGIGQTQEDTQSSCTQATSVTTQEIGNNMAVLIGIIVPFLLVIALLPVVLLIVRRKRGIKEPVDIPLNSMEKGPTKSNGMQSPPAGMGPSQMKRAGGVKGQSTTPAPRPCNAPTPPQKAWKPHRPVSLQDLPSYVKTKKANGNKAFIRDYASFPDKMMYSCDIAQRDINQKKNRYANIIPYDCSRVLLDRPDINVETDYINASYIDGYKQTNAYIATQGPNKSSTPDFWHMVWQQEVAIIVMLTNVVENGKKKCVKYWPEDQLNYNGIVVKLTEERVEQDFTVRTFVIANINIKEDIPREVQQFHFTSWPDMGLPDSPAPLMSFIHEVKQMEEDYMGPMVVHCSAGVGRTGTFITVDAMLNMVAEEKQINVIDFVHEMRKKRPKMVQTQDQYMFIFEVLLETLLCGDTMMSLNLFSEQYAALQHRNPLTGSTYIEEHFRVLDTMSVAPTEENCHGGRNEMNVEKNRYHDCIPLDKSRPYLMSPGDGDSTNYINASFIDAYKRKDGFLATQCPMPNTVVDFWRMVYDYNARVIVMLNPMDADETCASYWLDEPEMIGLYGIFEVQLRDCKSFNHTVARTFKLKNTNKQSEKPRTIHHFEFQDWEETEEVPATINSFLGFLELVDQGHRQAGGETRIAVHCLDGVSRCGIFCAAMASLTKLKEEKVVDVFHSVRNLRQNRDIMVETPEQYLFCYEVLKGYLEENQTYGNFR